MLLHIEPESTEPFYLQLRRQIILGLARGDLHFGEQLPAVRTMATELGINMMTVSKGYTQLKDEGYLVTHRQTGTHIAESIPMTASFQAAFAEQLEVLLADFVNHGQTRADLTALVEKTLATFTKGDADL